MTPEAIAAALGGRLLSDTEAAELLTCPGCATPTQPSAAGLRTYCFPCSEASLEGSFRHNSLRIEYGLSWASYWRRVEEWGPVWFAPKKWLSSVRRREQFRKRAS